MKCYVVTPTRDRPIQMMLLQHWISRQTFQDFRWIVVDDGGVPAQLCMGQIHIIRERIAKISYLQNLLAGIDKAMEDTELSHLFIVEDDDWYSPICFESMLRDLREECLDAVGFQSQYMYSLSGRIWKEFKLTGRLRTSQTMFLLLGPRAIPKMRDSIAYALTRGIHTIRRATMLARYFYGRMFNNDLRILTKISGTTCQIKGIPGPYITSKHLHFGRGFYDIHGKKLREIVGREDARLLLYHVGPNFHASRRIKESCESDP